MEQIASDDLCRLCSGSTQWQFQLKVLHKYDVGFSRCSRCGSLQTDEPFWLDEAYADQRRYFDTGAVVRNQDLQSYVWCMMRLFGLPRSATALDWGGADGLFTRMMRDIGIDAYHHDRYRTNMYAAGFDDVPGKRYDVVTAFEVWEHFDRPAEIIEEILSRCPSVLLVTTELYAGQGADWQYIWPTTGRHIFFATEKAMRFIADKYDYRVVYINEHTVFYNIPISAARRRLLKLLISHWDRRLIRTIFAFRRGIGLVESDRLTMAKLRGQPGA